MRSVPSAVIVQMTIEFSAHDGKSVSAKSFVKLARSMFWKSLLEPLIEPPGLSDVDSAKTSGNTA